MLLAASWPPAPALRAQPVAPLPIAVTNNAVASGRIAGVWWAFSVLGVDSTKRWSGITRRAFAWSSEARAWRALPDVPGMVGRLAATAQVVRGRLYVVGGYTVDSAGVEHSLANVDIYDPATGRWSAGAPTPVAVDDAVSGVYRDSLVYLVSGWHETDNVRDVQLYDVAHDRWTKGTPIPGRGVFGHTGALAAGRIVFVDGAAKTTGGPKYALVRQAWIGTINPRDPERISWQAGVRHPGPPLYRAAAAVCGALVVIAGGTANPYNYNGIGYDSQPSAPRKAVLAYDTRRGQWRTLPSLPTTTMDHRGLLARGTTGWIIGGMRASQRVSAETVRAWLPPCD